MSRAFAIAFLVGLLAGVVSAQVQPRTPRAPAPAPKPIPTGQALPTTRPATLPTTRAVTVPFAIGHRPVAATQPVPSTGVTDEEIGKALQRAVDHIITHFHEGGTIKGVLMSRRRGASGDDAHYTGTNALAAYALLLAGQVIDDPRIGPKGEFTEKLLNELAGLPIDGAAATYARGLRATALAVYNRPQDRETIKEDAAYLIKANINGGYTYGPSAVAPAHFRGRRGPRGPDNSNSQYGLLGVWSAAEAGLEIPTDYWRKVQAYWVREQLSNGAWGYWTSDSSARYSMTLAGLASLFVTYDYVDAMQASQRLNSPPFPPPIARGLRVLEFAENWDAGLREPGKEGMGGGYNLYALERVALASGFKYIGGRDWYRALASRVLGWQQEDGSFGDLLETCYCVAFLARAKPPIFMNKLMYEGAWSNRSRDISNLTRFARRTLERQLNWQIVPIDVDYDRWLDAPILYVSGNQTLKFSEQHTASLANYVQAGGMIFSHADGGQKPFNDSIMALGPKLFGYEWADLPLDHELYSMNAKVDPKPRLQYLSNGVRIIWIHSPTDIAINWQMRADKTKKGAFDLGLHLFAYATAKSSGRNRLVSHHLPEPQVAPTSMIPVARLKYAGNWNPEPGAYRRFSRAFQYRTSLGVGAQSIDLTNLDARDFPVAHLTGTSPHTFSDADITAIQRYVTEGGTLLVDSAGGSPGFTDSARATLIDKAFPGAKPAALPKHHPLLAPGAPGMSDLSRPRLLAYAGKRVGNAPTLDVFRAGKGRVLITPLDLTHGLLGVDTWSVIGYEPQYAESFLTNLLLWTWDGAKEM